MRREEAKRRLGFQLTHQIILQDIGPRHVRAPEPSFPQPGVDNCGEMDRVVLGASMARRDRGSVGLVVARQHHVAGHVAWVGAEFGFHKCESHAQHRVDDLGPNPGELVEDGGRLLHHGGELLFAFELEPAEARELVQGAHDNCVKTSRKGEHGS